MTKLISILWIAFIVGITMLPLGCGSQEDAPGGHHGEESPSGASFKPGKGVIVQDETKKILGLGVAEVTEELLPQAVQLNVQVFTESHRVADLNLDHTGCQFHGSGFLPPEKAAIIKPEQTVKFQTSSNEFLEGFVVSIQEPVALGEMEVIVGITTEESGLVDGEFVNAVILVPRDKPVTVIPKSALLRTAEGHYVYTVNGGAYYRTAVKMGSQADGKIEITDGLYAGDQVVVKPVETLWLIELRATKGGGHSH